MKSSHLPPTGRLLAIAAAVAISFGWLRPVAAQSSASDAMSIGFILKTMQEERYRTDKALFTARAESLGARVLFDSSSNDELVQLRQVEKMLDEGVRVLVLQPVNTGTAGSLVRLAHDQGVKVVGYDSMLQDGPLDLMVMQDSWRVGALQGEAMVRWFEEHRGEVKGRVVLIQGQPNDANAEAMSEGVLETVAAHPGLELIAQRSHLAWSPDLARETAETLLVKYRNQIDAFACNNSGLAWGVLWALEAEGLADANKVFVAGADADLRNVQAVARGKQAVEIWKKIKPLAYRAAEIAVAIGKDPERKPTDLPEAEGFRLIQNGYAEIPTVVTPVVLVTRETIDDTVVAEGFFTQEEIYGKERP